MGSSKLGGVLMKVVNFVIKEQTSASGKKYNALFVVTDDPDNPEKLIGYVNPRVIVPYKKKES